MTNTLAETSSPTLIRPTRSLGGLAFDIVVEETHEDGLVITEHPVERGAPISDHAYLKPKAVTIRGAATNAGSSLNRDGDAERVTTLYDKLLELQASREPFDVVTGKRSYTNMLLETLAETTDSTSTGTLQIVANCREVIIVETRTTTVPARSRHANAAKTGGVEDKGDKQPKRSAFAEAAGGSGNRRPGGPA